MRELRMRRLLERETTANETLLERETTVNEKVAREGDNCE